MNTEKRTIEIIETFRNRLPDEFVDMYKNLAQHAEWGVALEDLCTQLYEFDITPSAQELEEIKSLAKSMNMADDVWNFLAPSSP